MRSTCGDGEQGVQVEADLTSVYLAVMLDKMGAMMILPLLPYIATQMSGSAFAVGLMQSLYSLMQVFGTMVLGALSDGLGKRRILLVSLFSSSVFLLACGLAASLSQLLFFRACHGFFSGTVCICQAIVADVTGPEERVGKMAWIMAAYGVGVVLGPGIAGFVAPFGMLAVCATAALCTLINFLLAARQLPQDGMKEQAPLKEAEEDGGQEAARSTVAVWKRLLHVLLADPVLGAVCCISLLQEFAMGIYMGVSPLLFKDVYGITASQLGIIFCVAGTSMIVFQGFVVSRFVRIVGKPASILCGCTLRLLLYSCLAAFSQPLLPVLSAVCVVAGGALVDPCAASLTSDRAPKGLSGVFMGAYQSAASVGAFLGPVTGGLLYGFSKSFPYEVASVACLACLPVVQLLWMRARSKDRHGPSPSPQPAATSDALLDKDGQADEDFVNLQEASPSLSRAMTRLRSVADLRADMFQLPLPTSQRADRSLRHMDRIVEDSSEQLQLKDRSRTEAFSQQRSRRALSSGLEKEILRRYSMDALDRQGNAVCHSDGSLKALLVKWSQFHDGRDFSEFLMDSSKQLIGAAWIHLLNLLFAQKMEKHYEQAGGDECDWYWINIVVDCTLGVACTYVLLQLSTRIILATVPDQAPDFKTGEYRVNGGIDAAKYIKQLAVWLVVVSSMKVGMVVFMAVFHTLLLAVARMTLAPFASSPNLKLLVAMIATPFCMNALQFWVTDNFIKKQGGPAEVDDDDIEMDERGGRTKIAMVAFRFANELGILGIDAEVSGNATQIAATAVQMKICTSV
ncbi:tetA [Symbiodinium microadriaticum]|nr:tetA [Symbiodinium microadriaticum]